MCTWQLFVENSVICNLPEVLPIFSVSQIVVVPLFLKRIPQPTTPQPQRLAQLGLRLDSVGIDQSSHYLDSIAIDAVPVSRFCSDCMVTSDHTPSGSADRCRNNS